MRFVRFTHGTAGKDRIGIVQGDQIADVTSVLDDLAPVGWPAPPGDALIAAWDDLRPKMHAAVDGAPRVALADARLASPVANPSKIIGAPVNYQKHLDESRESKEINYGSHVRTIDELGVFLKANTSLVGASDGVEIPTVEPWSGRRFDHEVELAVIIGKGGHRIARDRAMGHVMGYAIGLDMTVRGTEDRSFRKSLDSFTVLGPALVTADEIADPGNLDFSITVNGEPRQASNTSMLVYDIPRLIEYASSAYTLYPGDIILTGTPEGVAPVQAGDVMHAWIDQVGEMDVAVR